MRCGMQLAKEGRGEVVVCDGTFAWQHEDN